MVLQGRWMSPNTAYSKIMGDNNKVLAVAFSLVGSRTQDIKPKTETLKRLEGGLNLGTAGARRISELEHHHSLLKPRAYRNLPSWTWSLDNTRNIPYPILGMLRDV